MLSHNPSGNEEVVSFNFTTAFVLNNTKAGTKDLREYNLNLKTDKNKLPKARQAVDDRPNRQQ